jgi:hypothetical protein
MHITRSYFRSASAVLVVFDVTDTASFEQVDGFLTELHQAVRGVREGVPIVLVGNKIDLHGARQVTHADASALAARWEVTYVETSAAPSAIDTFAAAAAHDATAIVRVCCAVQVSFLLICSFVITIARGVRLGAQGNWMYTVGVLFATVCGEILRRGGGQSCDLDRKTNMCLPRAPLC